MQGRTLGQDAVLMAASNVGLFTTGTRRKAMAVRKSSEYAVGSVFIRSRIASSGRYFMGSDLLAQSESEISIAKVKSIND